MTIYINLIIPDPNMSGGADNVTNAISLPSQRLSKSVSFSLTREDAADVDSPTKVHYFSMQFFTILH